MILIFYIPAPKLNIYLYRKEDVIFHEISKNKQI